MRVSLFRDDGARLHVVMPIQTVVKNIFRRAASVHPPLWMLCFIRLGSPQGPQQPDPHHTSSCSASTMHSRMDNSILLPQPILVAVAFCIRKACGGGYHQNSVAMFSLCMPPRCHFILFCQVQQTVVCKFFSFCLTSPLPKLANKDSSRRPRPFLCI